MIINIPKSRKSTEMKMYKISREFVEKYFNFDEENINITNFIAYIDDYVTTCIPEDPMEQLMYLGLADNPMHYLNCAYHHLARFMDSKIQDVILDALTTFFYDILQEEQDRIIQYIVLCFLEKKGIMDIESDILNDFLEQAAERPIEILYSELIDGR